MAGLADASEAAILDNATVGFGRTLYLALIQWTGAVGQGPGKTVNDDGTFPSNVQEIATGSYARATVASNKWDAAVAGSPTRKTFPTSGQTVTFTPSGASWTGISGYAWVSHQTNPISSANLVSSGIFVDGNGDPMVIDKTSGQSLTFGGVGGITLTERLGDAPNGTDPT